MDLEKVDPTEIVRLSAVRGTVSRTVPVAGQALPNPHELDDYGLWLYYRYLAVLQLIQAAGGLHKARPEAGRLRALNEALRLRYLVDSTKQLALTSDSATDEARPRTVDEPAALASAVRVPIHRSSVEAEDWLGSGSVGLGWAKIDTDELDPLGQLWLEEIFRLWVVVRSGAASEDDRGYVYERLVLFAHAYPMDSGVPDTAFSPDANEHAWSHYLLERAAAKTASNK